MPVVAQWILSIAAVILLAWIAMSLIAANDYLRRICEMDARNIADDYEKLALSLGSEPDEEVVELLRGLGRAGRGAH